MLRAALQAVQASTRLAFQAQHSWADAARGSAATLPAHARRLLPTHPPAPAAGRAACLQSRPRSSPPRGAAPVHTHLQAEGPERGEEEGSARKQGFAHWPGARPLPTPRCDTRHLRRTLPARSAAGYRAARLPQCMPRPLTARGATERPRPAGRPVSNRVLSTLCVVLLALTRAVTDRHALHVHNAQVAMQGLPRPVICRQDKQARGEEGGRGRRSCRRRWNAGTAAAAAAAVQLARGRPCTCVQRLLKQPGRCSRCSVGHVVGHVTQSAGLRAHQAG